jgi:DNA-binding beta-propeller fold protein YncE
LLRNRWTAPVIAAVAGLAIAASGAAASAASAHVARAGLRIEHTIRLAKANDFSQAAEAPNGSVYFTDGGTVYVVNGDSAPSRVTALGSTIIALAANSKDLFLQTGRTVYEYSRSTEAYAGHTWTLPVPARPTSAGLLAVGGTLWSWVDYATDQGGFEFATVSVLNTESGRGKVISKGNVYPADVAAGTTGLYFQAVRGNGANGYIVRASSTGAIRRHADVNIGAPAALSAGRLDIVTLHGNGRRYIDSFSATTLAALNSKQIPADERDIAGTSAGLLVLKEPCAALSVCKNATVGVLNPRTGSDSGAVRVAGAYLVLPGPAPAALSVAGGRIYLVRLGG